MLLLITPIFRRKSNSQKAAAKALKPLKATARAMAPAQPGGNV
jgi:hypothetical protein